MKTLIKKIIFFLIPIIIYCIAEVTLIKNITTRPWEALSYLEKPNKYYGSFYQDINYEVNSVGDLAHHTNYEIVRLEKWITDSHGFRNNKLFKSPDIVIIGDSFIVGSGLNQNDILSNVIMTSTHNKLKVYNMAPSSIEALSYFIKNKIINKPKLIIYSNVERNDIPLLNDSLPIPNNTRPNNKLDITIDRLKRNYLMRYIASRILGRTGVGYKGKDDMFFFSGININLEKDDVRLKSNINSIVSYNDYCQKNNLEFIYLPMPNKESVYFDLVPLNEQPTYLTALNEKLKENNINTINTLDYYNNYRKTNKKLLYQSDDTHWNENGVQKVSELIINKYFEMFKKRSITQD